MFRLFLTFSGICEKEEQSVNKNVMYNSTFRHCLKKRSLVIAIERNGISRGSSSRKGSYESSNESRNFTPRPSFLWGKKKAIALLE